jgi:hypothetical protein
MKHKHTCSICFWIALGLLAATVAGLSLAGIT